MKGDKMRWNVKSAHSWKFNFMLEAHKWYTAN